MASMDRPAVPALQNVRALCKRNWWVFLIGGIASVAFGVLALLNPAAALLVLAIFFAASLLVDGAANLIGAFANREKDGWWLLLAIGALGVVVGGYLLVHPALTMTVFVFTVAFTAILLGILCVSLGFKIRQETEREWILYLTGGLSILFGLLILFQPLSGAVSVVYVIAFWAILTGALRIAFAFKVKSLRDDLGERIGERLGRPV
jgi:uncharacterized membrane protein HdeD (DUF308 family)